MTLGQLLVLALAAAAGIAGLFLAAAPGSTASGSIGLAIFIAAVIYAFVFIKRHFDRIEARH